jgi:hypothetical protein
MAPMPKRASSAEMSFESSGPVAMRWMIDRIRVFASLDALA